MFLLEYLFAIADMKLSSFSGGDAGDGIPCVQDKHCTTEPAPGLGTES